MQWLSRLEKMFSSCLERDVPLAGRTSLGIGGPAKAFLVIRSRNDLKRLSAFSAEESLPLWVIGGGTNLLVHDRGLEGVVLCSLGMNELEWEIRGDTARIVADSGVSLSKAVELSAELGWSGLEFATGIPGTIGGALAGNAGAEGQGLCNLLEWVQTIERGGRSRIWRKEEIAFSYRRSNLAGDGKLIVRCALNLVPATTQDVRSQMDVFRRKRRIQPRTVKTAGCVFKNPDTGISAGKLLDLAGCKELRRGGAKVSGFHANFLEVEKEAKAMDVYRLIEECRGRVYKSSGIWLELEIRLFGGPWGQW